MKLSKMTDYQLVNKALDSLDYHTWLAQAESPSIREASDVLEELKDRLKARRADYNGS